MLNNTLISQVKSLTTAERIELISAVWETLSSDEVPVSAKEMVLLDARLADLEKNPADQSPWSEVQARLKCQLP
ncbi:MAG: addiction module antitoxin [Methylomonas sp.]|jgi:putative addiction module component (TIGR02574 family)|nr:MAG: addiction module antitoxin [Methylomonas sp.]